MTRAADRMVESKLAGMQHLPGDGYPHNRGCAAVRNVTEQRMTCLGEMHANLMRTPCRDLNLDQAGRGAGLVHTISGYGRLAATLNGNHAIGGATTCQLRPEFPIAGRQLAGNQRQITFDDAMLAKSRRQPLVRPGMDGEDHHAACIPVKPLYHADTGLTVCAEELLQGRVERPLVARGSRLRGDSGRLVKNKQVLVAIKDHRQIDPERLKREAIHMKFDVLSCRDWQTAAAYPTSIDMGAAQIDQSLDQGAPARQISRQKEVKTTA